MEYVVDWHLVYRNTEQFAKIAPEQVRRPGSVQVMADTTGVNIFLEVRKPKPCLMP
jgi:extracellular factor (EF) 3-hydroxypalmitic acid methyl ester biosynthesis protein